MATDALRRLGFDLDHLARSSQRSCALEPRYQSVCLENIVSEIEQDWRFYAETCGVELLISAPSAILEADTRMLATILRNLVGNALKYTSRGGRVSVDVRLERNSARIEVHDTGSGIPSCRMATIFEAFDRAGRDEAADGLGLGLYIVRETARALQYPLTVHSVEGVGSTFTVTVPRVK
jgi:signal transduction histidine kinase